MRSLIILILMLYMRLVFSASDSSNFTNDYVHFNNILDAQFDRFLMICETDSVIDQWTKKKSNLIFNTQKVIEDVEKSKKFYQNSEVELFAFLYLRTVNTYELERKTLLVNELGNYLLIKRLNESNIEQRIKVIEEKFNKYSNTKSAKLYLNQYKEFNDLRYEIEKIKNPPLKLRLDYETKEHAYQMIPDIFIYKLLDWQNQIDRIDIISQKLDKIEIGLKNTTYILPRDETSWITLIIQLVILGALLPTFLLTYKVKHNQKLILVVVFSSIVLSSILIFINPTTWQNIVFGAIIPGLFYIYYHQKLKGRINGDRISHPFTDQTLIEIRHNFGYTPHVSVYDEKDEKIECDVKSNEEVTLVEANIKISGRVELS